VAEDSTVGVGEEAVPELAMIRVVTNAPATTSTSTPATATAAIQPLAPRPGGRGC
jgi:hypothetical protein